MRINRLNTYKGTKHLWLYNEENVPEWRKEEFDAFRGTHLKTGRAWAIKEALRGLWGFSYPKRAEAFFRRWYFWATHSRLNPVIAAAKTLSCHLPNILTYFKHRISNATAEGLNSKIQMVKEMACGFRNREHYKTAIYFHCGSASTGLCSRRRCYLSLTTTCGGHPLKTLKRLRN